MKTKEVRVKNKAKEELEYFKKYYLDPLGEYVNKNNFIMDGWDKKNITPERQKLINKYQSQYTKHIDYLRLHGAMWNMIEQYNNQVEMLLSIYNDWYKNISVQGEQPKDLMEMQALLLQSFFQEKIKKTLELLETKITD